MLSTRQKQKIVKILEEECIELGKELTTRIPVLKELERDYNDQKFKVDTLQAQLEENKSAISDLIGTPAIFKGKTHKVKNKRAFRWIKETVKLLETQKRFLTIDEIISSIVAIHPEAKISSQSFKGNYPRTFKTKIPKILEWKGKIGLSDWFLNDQPHPKFLKEFLYAAS